MQLHSEHKKLVEAEAQLSKARLDLVQWKIAHKKLQVYALTKGMTAHEIDEAYALELTNEMDFLNSAV